MGWNVWSKQLWSKQRRWPIWTEHWRRWLIWTEHWRWNVWADIRRWVFRCTKHRWHVWSKHWWRFWSEYGRRPLRAEQRWGAFWQPKYWRGPFWWYCSEQRWPFWWSCSEQQRPLWRKHRWRSLLRQFAGEHLICIPVFEDLALELHIVKDMWSANSASWLESSMSLPKDLCTGLFRPKLVSQTAE